MKKNRTKHEDQKKFFFSKFEVSYLIILSKWLLDYKLYQAKKIQHFIHDFEFTLTKVI